MEPASPPYSTGDPEFVIPACDAVHTASPAFAATTAAAGYKEVPMRRLMITATAAVVVLAAAILWSHVPSVGHTIGMADNASQRAGTSPAVSKLPIEEYEDMSLVYSAAPKR
jgi:hypothetical protein